MAGFYRIKALNVVVIVILSVWLAGCNSSSPSSPSTPPTVYGILAVDDIDLMSGSGGIGPSDALDIGNITQWLNTISQNTGFPTNITVLKASDGKLTGNALAAALAEVRAKITNNDVVVFWYSGHGGANENSGGSKWPLMAFQDPSGRYNYADVDFNADVIVPLKALGAKLVIAAADCCNNYSWQAKLMPFVQASVSENYKTLFAKQGSLVMAGAARGEFSIAENDGGAFTNQFLSAFYANVASDPSWQTITAMATSAIRTGSDVQHPLLELNLD